MMTDNQIPSPSGARTAGDYYQWLHAWRVCMEAIHQDITKNTTNPTIAVGIEEPGVGNGDDVVRHRKRPPHAYMQVKYAVDHRTPFDLEYLDSQGVLKKMVAAHKDITADGTPAEMRLITNRVHHPDDVLLSNRDARDGKLVPRGAQDGPKSVRGRARTAWAEAAGTDEATLMVFLRDTHFDIAYDLPRLHKEVSLLMTANGLRSEDSAVDQGAGWIGRQVIAGRRRLTLADIKDAITEMSLQAGSPWTTVSVATIQHDTLADEAAVSIDWVDRIAGDTPWKRVAPKPPHTWAGLADDIADIPGRLVNARRVLVTGHLRQATGFLIGAELRRVRRYNVGMLQNEQLWTGDASTEPYGLDINEHPVGAGPDIALIVNVAANAADVTAEWIQRSGLPVANIVVATPSTGTGPAAVPTAVAANSAATAIRDLARTHANAPAIHLFLIGPLGLAVLLGHHWNRVTTTHVYEHLGGTEYTHAFTVDA